MAIQGITKKVLNNGNISWFGNYRDPNNNNQPTRRKLGTTYKKKEDKEKKRDHIKDEKKAVVIFEDLKDRISTKHKTLEEDIQYKNYLTLNQLANLYFDERAENKREELWSQFKFLKTEEAFNNYSTVKEKLSNLQRERKKYNHRVAMSSIGFLRMNELTITLAKKFKDKELRYFPLALKSKSNIINQIKTIINYGIKNDIINVPNSFKNLSVQHDNNQRDRALSEEELKLLLDTCKKYKHSENVYLSVYLAVLTAGRSNTILNIKKSDIDTNNNTITLYNFKANRKYKLGLNEISIKWLKEKVLPHYERNEFLIRPIDIEKRVQPYQPFRAVPKKVYKIMDELFNQELDKSNNQDRDNVVNFHTLRRSVATNLSKNETSIYDIMILLNHSNITQTMKYLNLSSNSLDKNVNTFLNNIFS